MTRPVALDLCSGLGGWAEGLEAEGWDVIRVDIEDMFAATGTPKPANCLLMLQDILTVHGSQFKHAGLIVASPPCQEYSYMAMPWSLAKAKAARIRADETGAEIERLNRLFNACFRIQREACEAAGRHIPMVVENVKGAQPWVGRARWAFGSYFLWGDVPALMPIQKYHSRLKVKAGEQWNINRENFTGTRGWDDGVKNGETGGGSWFAIGSPGQAVTGGNPDGRKNPGFRFDRSGRSFQSESVDRHVSPAEGFKSAGMDWSNRNLRGQDFTAIAGAQASVADGRKADGTGLGRTHPNAFGWAPPTTSSKGSRRKAASAKIAKIPLVLSRHIGRCYFPRPDELEAA